MHVVNNRRPIWEWVGWKGLILSLFLVTGCSSFGLDAPRPGESELVRWIEWTHEVCEAIKEVDNETS